MLAALLIAALSVKPVTEVPHLYGQGKPAVLHFWATWCEACREEFPALRPLLLRLQRRGVAVELISIDTPELGGQAEQMLAGFGLSRLPAMLIDAPDPGPVAAAVGEKKWDGVLPATFVYDSAGKLVRSFIGRIGSPAELDAAVRAAAGR
jgi:thiol-disulfide isomerase/thioredoxin